MSKPSFQTPVSVLVERFPEKETYTIISVDSTAEITESDLERIVECCNEELVYKVLFSEKFNGKSYVLENAKHFISWAKEGWSKQEWFVFLIRDPENKIVGAVDIKSNNLESAEVGYWMTKEVSGVMTNAVIALCNIAKTAGYKSLYALTVLDNKKSQGVLVRADFNNEGEVEMDGKQHLKFTKVV